MSKQDDTDKGLPSKNELSDNTSTESRTELRLLPLLMKFFKLSGIGLAVWLVGYTKFSFLWIVIALFLYVSNLEYKKLKANRRLYTQQATRNEQEAISARLSDLPSWVYFPDVERAEWLNKMIQQFWPFVGEYVRTLLKTKIEPQINTSLPEKLKPFKFLEVDLGDLPPRIGGVKVYTENVKRDEIIMDMEVIYASDSVIKVSVRNMTAGIKEFSLRADMRVIFNPLCNVIPLFGGMSVFFLRKPEIDFDLTDMANALDFPLFGNTVRSVIEDQIAAYLVLPNRIPIKILEETDMKRLQYPLPQGVLRIHALGARDLEKKDVGLLGKGKSDPFCEITAGSSFFKTSVIENTTEPIWNEYFEAVIDQTVGQSVEIHCFDKDPTGENDNLGITTVDMEEVMKQGLVDSWAPLETVKKGMIHMRYLWLYLSSDPADLERSNGKQNEEMMSSAILLVMLDSAKNLVRSKKTSKEPSPKVKLTVGNVSKESLSRSRSVDPRWEQNFLFMVNDPRMQSLDLEVLDTAKNDKQIGSVSIQLKSLLETQNLTTDRPYKLETKDPTTQTTIFLRLCLRILTSEKPLVSLEEQKRPVIDPATSEKTKTETSSASASSPSGKPPADIPASTTTTSKISAVTPAGGVTELPKGTGVTTPSSPTTKISPTIPGPVLTDNSLTKQASLTPNADKSFTSGENLNVSTPVTPKPPTIVNDSELRHRNTPSVVSSSKFGSIQLTIRYSMQRRCIVCVIHKCVKLIPCDSANLADPYVRLYLLPERSNSSKRKTQVQKDTLNPVFDETFDWSVNPTDFASKSIEVGVKNSIGMLSKQRENMGKIVINLANYDIAKAVTEWFDLEDPGSD